MKREDHLLLLLAFVFLIAAPACNTKVMTSATAVEIHDTIAEPNPPICDTIMMADTMRGKPFIEPIWDGKFTSSMQYKIWQQRKQKMKQWAAQYPFIQMLSDAHIIDVHPFPTAHGNRELVAWMTDLSVHLDEMYKGEDEEKNMWWYRDRGAGYFHGALHFTLVDPKTHKEINTVHFIKYLRGVMFETNHSMFDEALSTYPFAGEDFLYYTKAGGPNNHTGEADIMHFFDANGDGRKHEFVLYNKDGMRDMDLYTALFGYNEKRDSFYAYQWTITTYTDIGNPGAELFTLSIPDYAYDFSYIKKYGSGTLSKYVAKESWLSEGEMPQFDSTGFARTEYFDHTQYLEPTDYVYSENRYDSVLNQYLRTEVRLSLYYEFISNFVNPLRTQTSPDYNPQ